METGLISKRTMGHTARRAVVGAAAAGALLVAGAAQAALQDRDLDGDTVVDAFFDTDLNITWLRNADVNGLMDWDSAVGWAAGFSFAGYDDWRLPTSDTCEGFDCTGSEMGHLWYVELGNTAGSITNTGGFQNLQAYNYWSGTEWAPDPTQGAWNLNFGNGDQYAAAKYGGLYAMAVRDGDVAAIPEPQTAMLLLAGLAALALARRPRRR